MEKSFLLNEVVEEDQKANEDEVLDLLKSDIFKNRELINLLLVASERGWIKCIKYILSKVRFDDKNINYALCWASFAKEPKRVFDFLIKDQRFDLTFCDNEALMWALETNNKGKIQSEYIALKILNEYDIHLSNKNFEMLYDCILESKNNSYQNVVIPIFNLIEDTAVAQDYFELFVSKGYKEAVSKILEVKKGINLHAVFKETLAIEDFEMSEILSKHITPTEEELYIIIEKGYIEILQNVLKKGKIKRSILLKLFDIAIKNNNIAIVKFLNEMI